MEKERIERQEEVRKMQEEQEKVMVELEGKSKEEQVRIK